MVKKIRFVIFGQNLVLKRRKVRNAVKEKLKETNKLVSDLLGIRS